MSGPSTVDEYLSNLPQKSRAALEDLRETIKSVVPEATEVISYQIPTFKVQGRSLVAYAAFKDHCSLFPMSKKVIADHGEALEPYASGKATIRFQADAPLPAELVKKIVRSRMEENATRKRG